jgi:hypothetical protein
MQRLVATDPAQASFFEALKHNPRQKNQVKSKQPSCKTHQPPEKSAEGAIVVIFYAAPLCGCNSERSVPPQADTNSISNIHAHASHALHEQAFYYALNDIFDIID